MNETMSPVPMDKKALLLINPVSGKKQVLKHLPSIIRQMMDAGYLPNVCVTSRRGEATELAGRLGPEMDLVCCAGGDGTLNEVLTGLAKEQVHVPLGYVPCGSTNDFAASHALSLDIPTAAARMVSGPVKSYDIGWMSGAYFSYVAAIGAFSWLSYTTDQNLKNMLGHTAYILDAIKDVYKIRPIELKITAPGGCCYEGEFIFAAVCNSSSVAGTIELPRQVVDMEDGAFEVLLIAMPKTLQDLDAIIRGLLNQDYSYPLIHFFQAKSLEIQGQPGMEWALDGEKLTASDGRLSFHTIPGFLQLRG